MGLNKRKKSGKQLSGTRLIVPGLPMYTVKRTSPNFKKQRRFDADNVILPTTTTTTTIPVPVETCYIVTQDNDVLITQSGDNLIWC
jgi:hypothetical protein